MDVVRARRRGPAWSWCSADAPFCHREYDIMGVLDETFSVTEDRFGELRRCRALAGRRYTRRDGGEPSGVRRSRRGGPDRRAVLQVHGRAR